MCAHTEHSRKADIFDSRNFVDQVLSNREIAVGVARCALNDIKYNYEGLLEAVHGEDAEKIHFYAHALKGVARLVKCSQLSLSAQQVDDYAKRHQLEDARRLTEAMADIYTKSTQALRGFCQV